MNTSDLIKAWAAGLLRLVLMAAAGWSVRKGIVDGKVAQQTVEALVPAGVAIAWSLWHKYAVHQKLRSQEGACNAPTQST